MLPQKLVCQRSTMEYIKTIYFTMWYKHTNLLFETIWPKKKSRKWKKPAWHWQKQPEKPTSSFQTENQDLRLLPAAKGRHSPEKDAEKKQHFRPREVKPWGLERLLGTLYLPAVEAPSGQAPGAEDEGVPRPLGHLSETSTAAPGTALPPRHCVAGAGSSTPSSLASSSGSAGPKDPLLAGGAELPIMAAGQPLPAGRLRAFCDRLGF